MLVVPSLICLAAGVRVASASPFLSVEFDTSPNAGDVNFSNPTNLQTGFSEFQVGAFDGNNTTGPITTSSSYTYNSTSYSATSGNLPYTVSDPEVPGGSVGVGIAVGDSVNGSGLLSGAGALTNRFRGGYSGTYAKLYSGFVTAASTSSGTVPTTLQLTGLVAGDSYSVTIFAADHNNVTNGGTPSDEDTNVYPSTADGTTGTSGSITWTATDNSTLTQYSTTLTLVPNSNGQMTIDILGTDTTNDWGALSGFQVADAPEPSSLGLMLAAALPTLGLRRRRRAN
jgi:hypothetical protein